jgi:hypothetical protein
MFTNFIAWIKGLYQKDLTTILSLFDKAHAQLDVYINEAKADIATFETHLGILKTNVATATVAQAALTAITSAPNPPVTPVGDTPVDGTATTTTAT